MSESTNPSPENPEEPNVSYGCCLAAARPVAAMLLLFAAPGPESDAGSPAVDTRAHAVVPASHGNVSFTG